MITQLKVMPLFFLYRRSPARFAIERDAQKWVQFYKPKEPQRSSRDTLAWLLEEHPEFRNLLYARLGRYSNLAGRILLSLGKAMFPPQRTPGFPEPINIGPGLFIYNGFGVVAGAQSMGEDCWIGPAVTLGFRDSEGGLPVIGSRVFIGAGAKVLGPVTVGDDARIGANAVVLKDVPPGCTVAGVPARVVRSEG